MGTLEAVNLLLSLTQAAANSAAAISQVSTIIQRATSEGRTMLNPDEEAGIKALDDAARNALAAEIQRRLAA